jgi:beta-lactamase regulating signal transducer with metallopeptidase domain
MTSLAYMLLVPGPFGMIVKVTIVLVAAACLAPVLRRASASTRHLVWLASLVGSLAVVVVWPIAPQYGVVSHRIPYVVIATRVADYAGPARVVEPIALTRERSVGRAVRRAVSLPLDAFVAHPVPVFAATWLIGFLIVVGRCVLGHIAVARLVSRARPVSSLEWRETIDDALDTIRISRGVSVLISEDIAGPVTSGALRPVVLLPADAAMWLEERRRVVVVHEFAHIARFDYVGQLVATIACALFWFHPLAWFAAARLRSEAEHAADDCVLIAGTSGVSYASHLLDLARVDRSPHLSAAVAVGMVRASRLEGRFRAMLDATRSRSMLSPRFQALATSLTLAAMVPFAGLRAVVHGPRLLRAPFPTPPVVAEQVIAAPDSVIEKTIDASRGDRLVLDLETGGNIVLRGWDEPRVRMRALLAGDDWRDTRVSLERTGRGLRLTSEFSGSSSNRSTRHAFELWVPRGINVELSSAGGSVAINNVNGEFRGHTGGGSLVIEGASGTARLSTGGGNVRVTNSRLDGRVSTGGGEVTLSNVSGNLVGSSGSGPVITTTGVGTGVEQGVRATTTITGVGGGVSGGVG